MQLRKYTFILCCIVGILLIIFPTWDIAISKYFYDPKIGFIYAHNSWAIIIFQGIPIVAMFTTIFLIFAISVQYYKCNNKRECLKSPIVFLLLALALGPGFSVNSILKENFGRARPRNIVEFEGTANFSPAGYLSTQCKRNCSFSSGHAAMGFYFSSLSWIVPPPYQAMTFLGGFLFGSIVGFGRIVQGGHFFSDIIFSFVVVMIVTEISFRMWKAIYKNSIRKIG